MHKHFYKFFTSYRYAIAVVAFLLIVGLADLYKTSKLEGVFIDQETQSLICAENVVIHEAQSTSEFLENLFKYKVPTYSSMVCTANAAFSNTKSDKKALQNLVEAKLAKQLFRNREIEQYLLKKASQ